MDAAYRLEPSGAPAERLFRRCLFCDAAFPRTRLYPRVPPGDRFAYDPARGRVWCICSRCRRWNLIPLDDRHDAAEELERVVHDRGLLCGHTANIALYETDDLSIVRIGRARLVERVSWRYGRELISRATAYRQPRTRFVAATFGAVARAGEALGAWRLDRDWGPSGAADILRWQRFGSIAWTGRTPCAYCGSVLHTLHFDASWWLYPRIEEGHLVLGVPCTRCDPWTPRNVFDVRGGDAQQLLRRALAYQHVAGATAREVGRAAQLIEKSGSAEALIRQLASGRRTLWGLGPTHTLALEIAANHLAERHTPDLRLRAVEAEWRIEEGIAAIIDNELS